MSAAFVEALKQFLRTLVLGFIPILGGVLLFIKSGIDTDLGTFNIKWLIVLAMLASGMIGVIQTALMSGFDKWLHEKDVKTPLDLKSMDSLKE